MLVSCFAFFFATARHSPLQHIGPTTAQSFAVLHSLSASALVGLPTAIAIAIAIASFMRLILSPVHGLMSRGSCSSVPPDGRVDAHSQSLSFRGRNSGPRSPVERRDCARQLTYFA